MQPSIAPSAQDPGPRIGVPATEDLFDLIHDLDVIVWELDVETRQFTFVSGGAEEILGYPIEQWYTERDFWPVRIVHHEDREWAAEYCRAETEHGRDHRFEYRALHANGHVVWLRNIVRVGRSRAGRRQLRGVMIDISEQKQAESALQQNEKRVRTLIENISDIVAIVDAGGRFRYASPSMLRVLGYSEEEVHGECVFDLIHPEDREFVGRRIESRLRGDPDPEGVSEARFRHRSGGWRHLQLRGRRHEFEGIGTAIVVAARDVTEQKKSDDELRRQRAYFARLFEFAPEAIVLMDEGHRVLRVNQEFCRTFGFASSDAVGALIDTLIVPPDLRDEAWSMSRRAARGERVGTETVRRRKDGTDIPVSILAVPVPTEDGVTELYGIYRDLSDRKRVEQALRESEAHLRSLLQGVRAIVWECDALTWEFTYISQGVEEILGYPVEQWYTDPSLWIRTIHSDDRERVVEQCRSAMEAGRDRTFEYRSVASDGRVVWLRDIVHPVIDEAGDGVCLRGVMLDITEAKELEEKLWQAQKMEAVGRLAGGVAHDFNNVLTAIQGHVQLLADGLAEDDPLREDAEEIAVSVERAAALTRQLLAFSRKQILKPEPVDLNTIVTGMAKMLRRVVGEEIRLETSLATDLGHVLVDPSQIERVLLNLVLNARDAMPDGGDLAIETRNVIAGSECAELGPVERPEGHVLLSVRDTGKGIPVAVRERIFEPFFTTKQPGQGTGLGLSTAYGIVKQSGGHITVRTDTSAGTTFDVYLRRIESSKVLPHAPAGEIEDQIATGGETVLVVEDEPAVRSLIGRVLRKHGYVVIEAENGRVAAALIESNGRIDLVLTDVVMPEMGGRELAERIRRLRPDLPLVFMSGYTEDELVRRGVADGQTTLVEKPFSPATLTRKIREAIDRSGVRR
jgi:two-component system, cell cycle sensor histidine kinase and response regulator CckA